ncbi:MULTISPECIES: tetratricopeptide repeat protein [Komagataeibacter]|uniref:Tetratricopeptide repeat protein n=2 Tax=Komagataeibacter saccharivorans TaxID=265959 RepID=A0A347WA92_9PROT|nr:hypothetical protein CD178_00988 [Komagataeibacter saccharivorans]PYD51865.1 hypothetical protein CFR79_01935 [Komagataeibacter saccharivorans]
MPWPIIRAMTRSWKDIQLKNITSKSLFRLRGRLLAGAMMVLPVAMTVVPLHGVHAADVLGQKVGTSLQQAQTALAAHKYPQAMAAIDAADAVTGKTEYESYTIEQMRAAVAAQSGNVPAAISAYDKLIASSRTPAATKEQMALAEGSMAFTAKDYPQAIAVTEKYIKAGGKNPQMLTILIQAYYLQHDYANAARVQQGQIDATIKAGARPTENQLQLLAACQSQLHDTTGLTRTYVQLATYYPKPDYWAQVVHSVLSNPNMAPGLRLDIDRVRLEAGLVKTSAEYMDITELAMQAGLPQLALDIINQGYSSGVLGHDATAPRTEKLKALVTQGVAERKAGLDAATAQATTGNALLTAGYNYVLFGQADKGLAVMKQGIAKGPTDINIARLHLGLAQAAAGQKDAAIATLNSVEGTNGARDIAQFWVLKLNAAPAAH